MTPRTIIAAVAEHYGVTVDALRYPALGAPRIERAARAVAYYLCRQLTGESYTSIAREFGGVDHTTVLYGCRRVERSTGLFRLASYIREQLQPSTIPDEVRELIKTVAGLIRTSGHATDEARRLFERELHA